MMLQRKAQKMMWWQALLVIESAEFVLLDIWLFSK